MRLSLRLTLAFTVLGMVAVAAVVRVEAPGEDAITVTTGGILVATIAAVPVSCIHHTRHFLNFWYGTMPRTLN